VDAIDNPYSPGAGLRPAVLAGRQEEIAAFDALLQRGEAGRTARGMMLTGLRGVGKTVLLNELANQAVERDWIVAQLEVRPDGARTMLASMAALMTAGLRRQQGWKASAAVKRALGSIKAFSVTVDPDGSLSASIDIDIAGSGDVETDLTVLAADVGRAALTFSTGVAVFVDELQELGRHSMAALAAAAHTAGQRNVPFYVMGAGLPNLPGKLAEAKSYAERLFDYRPLGKLEDDTSREALAAPAAAAGVTWDPDALHRTTEAAMGYPYFLQEFGAATWNSASGPEISLHDAENGIRLGQAILDGGFFRSRWDRATATERLYLRAMAVDAGRTSRTPDVATRMGRTQSNLGPIRAGLIGKGIIFAPEYGVVAFTVPGMAEFIQRQTDD
jgi:type II secretory pathway predicted ATPase ExeA